MGNLADGLSTGGNDHLQNELQELLGIQASVHPDGTDAKLTIHTTSGHIDLSVQVEEMAAAHAEIANAALLMLYRRDMQTNDAALKGLLRTALTPVNTVLVTDPETGDRVFVMQFADRLPIAIRRTPEQCANAVTQMQAEARRTAN